MSPKEQYLQIVKLQRDYQTQIEQYEARDNPIDADMIRSIQAQFFWDVTAILNKGKARHESNVEAL